MLSLWLPPSGGRRRLPFELPPKGGSHRRTTGTIPPEMRFRYLLIAVLALVLQDAAAEGKRWWSHVEYLAADALEGREVGTPGFEKAAAYVEAQFKAIGLKTGGVS